jgi:group I intron endonuclease
MKEQNNVIIGIYKITNPKGKIYIGQTINWKERQKSYKCHHVKGQRKLYNSLIKYGWENHIKEIIEECSLNQLNEKERYWQEYFNVLENGLNCRLTKTDDKSGYMSIDSCIKKSQSLKAYWEKNPRKISEEHMLKMIEGRKGLTRSIETKEKMKNKKIGTSYRKKTIIQYDLNMNKIKEYSSAKEARDYLEKKGNSIADCASGRQKTAYGFIWKYKKDLAF